MTNDIFYDDRAIGYGQVTFKSKNRYTFNVVTNIIDIYMQEFGFFL